jgi:3-methyladenine DNA glycosylase AlkD
MKSPYLRSVKETFSANANLKNAFPMKKYMKDKFEFLGIKSPERRELQREFLRKNKLPDPELIDEIIKELWAMPEREYQYFGMELLEKYVKKSDVKIIRLCEYMIVTKSWWDTVDMIAQKLIGAFFKYHKEYIRHYSEKWMKSGNIWLQRTVILFQLKYKKETDTSLLFKYIKKLSGSKEFFIQKAIGWALREYSKVDPTTIIAFVDANSLAPLSRREALKIINK